MSIRTSLDFYRATVWSALGLSPLVACGGVASEGIATVNGGGASGARTGGAASGGLPTGGVPGSGGLPTGGVPGSGGTLTGGVPGSGGAPQTTCRNPQPFVGANGQPTGLVSCDGAYGAFHRLARVDCPSIVPRPAVNPGGCSVTPGSGFCCQDSDCAAQPYGHCEASTRGGPAGGGYSCLYGCVRDSQCATGEICLCGSAVGQCIPATCTTDADCGGLLCITSDSTSAPGGFCDTFSIACQTPTDRCTTDKDCGSLVPCVVMPSGERSCRDTGCAQGGVGRPFIVDGARRTAPARKHGEWSAPLAPRVDELCAGDRSELATRWTEIACAEHASIASNARFVLELLSIAAPADLVRQAQEAMGDEAVHARDAFALASAYAGRPVGPGPLDISGALTASSPRGIVRNAIVEGCIGETVAAVEAAEALAFAEDDSVRAALGRAASDEIRHAELAWRFIGWMIDSDDPELRREVVSCLVESIQSELRSMSSNERTSSDSSDVMRAHGFLDAPARREIRRRVIRDIVEPCVRSLVAETTAGEPA